LTRHQPVVVVLTLMVMHLGIVLVTHNALVRLAPVTDPSVGPTVGIEPGAPVDAVEPVHVETAGPRADESTPDPSRSATPRHGSGGGWSTSSMPWWASR
jgi:hypothetical protein